MVTSLFGKYLSNAEFIIIDSCKSVAFLANFIRFTFQILDCATNLMQAGILITWKTTANVQQSEIKSDLSSIIE